MLRFLKNLFTNDRPAAPRADVRYAVPPELDFADLAHHFDRRTFGFDSYRARLEADNPRLLHWIGSVDYSGYVREASLRYLIDHYQPGDENRILLRLEDWVPQVRALAEAWTRQHVCTLSLAQLGAQHRLLLYLARKERLRNRQGFAPIRACLLAKMEEAGPAAFFALHATFRRYLYGLGEPLHPRLRPWMTGDPDPFNRLLLLRRIAFDALTADEAEALRRDPSTMVKRAFLLAQIKHGTPPSEETLAAFALDRNRGIRAIGRFYLQQYYGVDAYTLYTQQQGEAFYYLADYAREADLPHFLAGMQSPRKRIRYLCLRAIAQIDPAALRGLDLKGLFIENRRFREVLAPRLPRLLALDELLAYKPLLVDTLANGRVVYLNLIARRSFWLFIAEALALLVEEPAAVPVAYLHQRFHARPYIYESLPDALQTRITALLDRLKEAEDPALRALLGSIAFAVARASS